MLYTYNWYKHWISIATTFCTAMTIQISPISWKDKKYEEYNEWELDESTNNWLPIWKIHGSEIVWKHER